MVETRRAGEAIEAEVVLAQRILAMSNLLKAGGPAGTGEIELLNATVEASALPAEARALLREAFLHPHQHAVDFEVFQGDDVTALMAHLVVLSGRAGARPAERLYVRQVAGRLGFPLADLDRMA